MLNRLGSISRSAHRGFTLVEMMIVVGLVALLGTLAVPSALKARGVAAKNICIANLRQIEYAKEQWAVEERKNAADIPMDADLFGLQKYLKYKPVCPDGGVYTLNANGQHPTCSLAGHTL